MSQVFEIMMFILESDVIQKGGIKFSLDVFICEPCMIKCAV